MGDQPGVEFGFDSLWTSSRSLKLLYRIDPMMNEVIAEIEAFDSVWVAALDRNALSRLDPDAFVPVD